MKTLTLLTCFLFFVRTASANVFVSNINTLPEDSALPVYGTGWYYVVDSNKGYKICFERTNEHLFIKKECLFINPEPIVMVKHFTKIKTYKDHYGNYGLSMKFDTGATRAWSIATGKSIGKILVFILDNKLISAPLIQSQIKVGVSSIIGQTKEDIEKMKAIIEKEEKQ